MACDYGGMSFSQRHAVQDALSHARLEPYLERTGGNVKQALRLYAWHAHLTAAVQTILGTTEVILRNAMDRQLQVWNTTQDSSLTSWLLEEPASPLRSLSAAKRHDALRRAINQAQARPTGHRRYNQPVTHDDVLAQVMFGMWKDLLPNHQLGVNPQTRENLNRQRLWEESLCFAFPHANDPYGQETFWRVAHLHRLRNRVSHMEPLLDIDVNAHIREAFDLVSTINPQAAQWLSGISTVSHLLSQEPHH